MKILLKILSKFTKPRSAGECLRRVKKAFNAVGEDIAHKPGCRIYKTPGKNEVHMATEYGSLDICKYLAGWNKSKDYIGKLAHVTRVHHNFVKPGDGKICVSAKTITHKFLQQSVNNNLFPFAADHNQERLANALGYSSVENMRKASLPWSDGTFKTNRKISMSSEQAQSWGLKI